MNKTNNTIHTQMEYYEKLTKEILEHKILKNILPLDKKHKDAFTKVAKAMGLSGYKEAEKEHRNLLRFCNDEIRNHIMKQILKNGTGCDRNVLSSMPSWIQEIDKTYGVFDRILKRIMSCNTNNLKINKILFLWNLYQSVEQSVVGKCRNMLESRQMLTSEMAVEKHAATFKLPVQHSHRLWLNVYQQAILKCYHLIINGDDMKMIMPCHYLTPLEEKIVELACIYDDAMQVVNENSFLMKNQLYILILLFRTIVAAKEKCCLISQNGVRHEIDSEKKNKDSSKYEEINTNNEIKEENNIYMEKCNFDHEDTILMWTLVEKELKKRNYQTPLIILQKRWHELKLNARKAVIRTLDGGASPHFLLLAIIKRFPFVITKEFPSWFELIKNGKVFCTSYTTTMSEEHKSLVEITDLNLDNVENIENFIYEQLNDSSDDNVEEYQNVPNNITINRDISDNAQTNEYFSPSILIKDEITLENEENNTTDEFNNETDNVSGTDTMADCTLRVKTIEELNSLNTSEVKVKVLIDKFDCEEETIIRNNNIYVCVNNSKSDTDTIRPLKNRRGYGVIKKSLYYFKNKSDNRTYCQDDKIDKCNNDFNDQKNEKTDDFICNKLNLRVGQNAKKIDRKRKLIKNFCHLSTLPKQFWTYRNIELLELCKPFTLSIEKITFPQVHLQKENVKMKNDDETFRSEKSDANQILNEEGLKNFLKDIVGQGMQMLFFMNTGNQDVYSDLQITCNNVKNDLKVIDNIILKNKRNRNDTKQTNNTRKKSKRKLESELTSSFKTSDDIQEWQRQKDNNLKYFNFKQVCKKEENKNNDTSKK